MQIEIPFNFTARPYQKEIFDADKDWIRNILLVRSRRAGKDKTLLNLMVKDVVLTKMNAYYVFPELTQWRSIFRDGIDNDGFKNRDHFPKSLVVTSNNNLMAITLANGSMINVKGTDSNVDGMRWTNPKHVILSEYSEQDPYAYNKVIKPILDLNKWKAHFCFTPKWKNHSYQLYEYARNHPDEWFVSVKKAYELYDTAGNRIITDEELKDIKQYFIDMGDIETYYQEYECSFEGSTKGAYYGEQLRIAEDEWRICVVPYESNLDTFSVRDMGMDDSTAIRTFQIFWKEVRILEYYHNSWKGLDHYANYLKNTSYRYTTHFLPHDAEVRELGTGISRREYLSKIWLTNTQVLKKYPVQDWIDAVRRILRYCFFNKEKCQDWLDALKYYHKEWNDKTQKFDDRPKHDWSSHWADSFRYLAIAYENAVRSQINKNVGSVFSLDMWAFV